MNRTPSAWLSRVHLAIAGADPDAPDIDVDVRERIADARAHVSKQKSAKREAP